MNSEDWLDKQTVINMDSWLETKSKLLQNKNPREELNLWQLRQAFIKFHNKFSTYTIVMAAEGPKLDNIMWNKFKIKWKKVKKISLMAAGWI